MVVLKKNDWVSNLKASGTGFGAAGGGGAVEGERLRNSRSKKQERKNAMIQQRAATRSSAEDEPGRGTTLLPLYIHISALRSITGQKTGRKLYDTAAASMHRRAAA
jgi:hypothetical protein